MFEPNDRVLIIVASKNIDSFLQRFRQCYSSDPLSRAPSNLGEEFQIFLCGNLPHARLFDPFGTRSLEVDRSIRFNGGLLADARANMFLMDYPPRTISYRGKALGPNFLLSVNGARTTVEKLLTDISKARQFSAFIVQIGDDRAELSVSRNRISSKPNSVYGYAIQNSLLEPVPSVLFENQPSLRGTVFTNASAEEESESEVSMTQTDVMLLLIQKGSRIALSAAAYRSLLTALAESQVDTTLLQIAITQIRTKHSIPRAAIASKEIRKCLKSP
jgi:hypothetical protein